MRIPRPLLVFLGVVLSSGCSAILGISTDYHAAGNDAGIDAAPRADAGTTSLDASPTDGQTPIPPELVLFGGFDDVPADASGDAPTDPPFADTWQWNGTTWAQAASADAAAPSGRQAAAMAALGGNVVLFGGIDKNAQVLGDTWIWNGSTWTPVSPASSPPARYRAGTATLGDKVVLFGGRTTTDFFDDTWQWDGTTWTQVEADSTTFVDAAAPIRPTAGGCHAMAALNGTVVLFGGGGSGQTWAWDGNQWALVATSGPAFRNCAAMATLEGKVVLFGGEQFIDGGAGTYYDDTWTWDGTNWTEVLDSGPPPARLEHVMATLADTVVLFGGTDVSGNALGDTWTWDGTRWTQVATNGPAPGARAFSAMALP